MPVTHFPWFASVGQLPNLSGSQSPCASMLRKADARRKRRTIHVRCTSFHGVFFPVLSLFSILQFAICCIFVEAHRRTILGFVFWNRRSLDSRKCGFLGLQSSVQTYQGGCERGRVREDDTNGQTIGRGTDNLYHAAMGWEIHYICCLYSRTRGQG